MHENIYFEKPTKNASKKHFVFDYSEEVLQITGLYLGNWDLLFKRRRHCVLFIYRSITEKIRSRLS